MDESYTRVTVLLSLFLRLFEERGVYGSGNELLNERVEDHGQKNSWMVGKRRSSQDEPCAVIVHD